ASVTQLEIMPRPPELRGDANPWPQYSNVLRVTSAHEEGGDRVYSISTAEFVDDGEGNVAALRVHDVEMRDGRFEPLEASVRELPADLVLLALGFVGPEKAPWLDSLGVALDERGNVARDHTFMTNVPGVFVAGDMGRGQSLIVWAIAEGRACAAGVDRYLQGETTLPAPIAPTDRALM
ncbi:MAG: FAD-dependent oxidoreductase, partial [Ilumatobacteraceae bacterium]